MVDVTPLGRLHSLGASQVQHILQSPQLDSRHAPMLRILDDWNELSHWACYAQGLHDRDEILGLELQEKLEGKWSQLPEHWAPATEVERRVIEGQWHSRNLSPILRL